MKKRINQQGFGVWEILLILLLIIILGFIGWYVWQQSQKVDETSKPQSSVEVVNQPDQQTSEDCGWALVYTPPGGEYTICVPDGWKLNRYSTSSGLYANTAADIVFASGTPATVTQVEDGRDFAAIPFALNYLNNSEFQGAPGTLQSSFNTDQGLTVDKYYNEVTTDPEFVGPPAGTKEYAYVVVKGGHTVYVLHDVTSGETDQTAYIEQSLKTLVLP